MKRLIITVLILFFISGLFASVKSRKVIAEKYLKRAGKYLENKDYFLAKRFYERAYRKFKVIKDNKGQFFSLKGLGDVNMRKGYLDRGFDMYNRAKYFAHLSGMVYTYAYVELCVNIARVHESHRQYKTAALFMKIATKIGRKIGVPYQNSNLKYLAKLKKLEKKFGNVGH